MIEVFKTNVTEAHTARFLIEQIQFHFDGYMANFDLEDCDHILRIQSKGAPIHSILIILLLEKLGYRIEVLPDEIPSFFQPIGYGSGHTASEY